LNATPDSNWAFEALVRRAALTSARARETRPQNEALDLREVRLSLDGDGAAFRRLMERHQARVAAIMWRFSRDPDVHEELVGDVFLEVFESLRTFRARAPFEHWLSRIATRVGYRYWKRRRRERSIETTPLEEWHEALAQPAETLAPEQASEILYGLVAMLPPRDRLVVTLRYLDDRSVEQTAQLTGWSQTMVKVQALRARRKLKKLFDEAMEEGGA